MLWTRYKRHPERSTPMSRTACPIVLTPDERAQLDRLVRARTSSQQQARRAQIVLRAAEGASNTAIAAALGVARHTVQHWRGPLFTGRAGRAPGRPPRPPPPPPHGPPQTAPPGPPPPAPARGGAGGE